MSKTKTSSLFDEIKASLSKKTESNYKDILKFEAGKTYQVRLVPNVTTPAKTIFHYYHHSWKSFTTNQFITALCPTTFGESCPIDSYVMRTYRNGTPEEKAKLNAVSRKENWLVNVYVISDPTNPENEGKVKVLRYGKELAKVIEAAISGDDADEFGVENVFSVDKGSTLRIKCEPRTETRGGGGRAGMMITYVSSRFLAPSKLDGIDAEKLKEIHGSILDLEQYNQPKSQAELQKMLDEHYLMLDVPAQKPASTPLSDDDVFAGVGTPAALPESEEEDNAGDESEAKLKALLQGL